MPDGNLDNNFAGGGYLIFEVDPTNNDIATDVVIDKNDDIIVTGCAYRDNSTMSGKQADAFVMKLKAANGALDAAFGSSGVTYVGDPDYDDCGNGITLENSEKLIVSGYVGHVDATQSMAVWRFDSDGTLDTTFNGSGVFTHKIAGVDSAGYGVSMDQNQYILVVGRALSGANYDVAIWRIK